MRIVLADDHRLMRAGLRLILEREPGFEVVGEADDGAAAAEMALELLPDVVVLDLDMPVLTGTEAAQLIRDKAPSIETVVVSMHHDSHYLVQALKAGAKSYILKSSAPEELVFAVRAAGSHKNYLSSYLTDLIVSGLTRSEVDPKKTSDILTPREYQAYLLLACGKSCREVGCELNISCKTAETYRQKVMKKLKVTNAVQLANYAAREGIVPIVAGFRPGAST